MELGMEGVASVGEGGTGLVTRRRNSSYSRDGSTVQQDFLTFLDRHMSFGLDLQPPDHPYLFTAITLYALTDTAS